jgi:hypothetical protein
MSLGSSVGLASMTVFGLEVLAATRMVERTLDRFDLYPERLIGDSACGSAECCTGWCMIAGSSRTFRCSTNRLAATAPTHAMTSPTIRRVTPAATQPGNILRRYRRRFTVSDRRDQEQRGSLPCQQERLRGVPAQAALRP